MQVPSTVLKYNIDNTIMYEAQKDFSKTFVEDDKGVALIDVATYDEKLSKGVLVRIPSKSKYNLMDIVYFPHSTVILKMPDCDITLTMENRIFKNPEKANYLLKFRTDLKLELLTNIVFELSRIDLQMLYEMFVELFNTNSHKKTRDLILREILNDLNTSFLSNDSDIGLISSYILKIYIRIKMKEKIKKGIGSISNEDIARILNLVDEYNSTKRSYKPIESFKKRLEEENIPVTFFSKLIEFGGTLTGRFNTKIRLN